MRPESTVEPLGNSTIYQYIASLTTVLSGLVFYIYIVRVLDTKVVGSVALILSFSGLFSVTFSLGLGSASKHFFSYHLGKEDRRVPSALMKNILSAGAILSLTVFVTVYLLSSYLSSIFFHSIVYVLSIKLVGVSIALGVMNSILLGMLLGLQRFRLNALVTSLQSVFMYTLPVILYFLNPNLESFVIGWIISASLVMTLGMTGVLWKKPYSGEISGPSGNTVLHYTTPIYLSSIVGLGAMYIDRLTVAYFMPLEQMAVYNLAILFYSTIAFLVSPINNILLPKVSEKYSHGNLDSIRKMESLSISLISFIYVPAAFGVAVVSNGLISTIAGTGYVGGATPLKLMLFMGAVSVPGNAFLQILAGTRNTKSLLITSSVGLSVNFALSVVLIPTFGLLGAAFAYSSVGISTLSLYAVYLKRAKIFSLDYKAQAKIFAAAVSMYLVVAVTQHFSHLGKYGLAIYFIEAIVVYIALVKVLKPLDRHVFKSATGEISGIFAPVARIAELLF